MQPKPTIGIVGAGRLGSAIARLTTATGYETRIANSREAASQSLILSVLFPNAIAVSTEDAIKLSDVVVLAIPLGKYKLLPPDLFKGKVVIDAMNYWAPTEGRIQEFADSPLTTSEYIQTYLPGAKVVKSLNHVAYSELAEHSQASMYANRRAIAVASNDAEAIEIVKKIIDTLGFDAVITGDLASGRQFQPDTPLFDSRLNAIEMTALLKR